MQLKSLEFKYKGVLWMVDHIYLFFWSVSRLLNQLKEHITFADQINVWSEKCKTVIKKNCILILVEFPMEFLFLIEVPGEVKNPS